MIYLHLNKTPHLCFPPLTHIREWKMTSGLAPSEQRWGERWEVENVSDNSSLYVCRQLPGLFGPAVCHGHRLRQIVSMLRKYSWRRILTVGSHWHTSSQSNLREVKVGGDFREQKHSWAFLRWKEHVRHEVRPRNVLIYVTRLPMSSWTFSPISGGYFKTAS